jgi:hypothetical protein
MTVANDFPMPFIINTEEAVRHIRRGLDSSSFEIAFPRLFVWLLKIGKILPARIYFAVTRRMI